MKKLTLGARIKSLLPTLSISLPAVITGILIFTETNLIDPLTSLLSKTEYENKKEKDTEGESKEDGEKGANGKEKSEKKGKGKGGKSKDGEESGSGDSLDTKGDKDSNKGKDEQDGENDQSKDGSKEDGQESGKANIKIECNSNEDDGSNSLNNGQATEKGTSGENVQGSENGQNNQNVGDNDEEKVDGAKVIGVESKDGTVEEKATKGKSGKSRGVAPAFWGYFGEELHEDW